MTKIAIVAGAALALSAGLALAQPPAAPATPSPRAAPPAQAWPGGDFGPRFERGRGGPGRWMGRRMGLTQQEIQKRNADVFARLDANRDGRVTFEEYRQDMERRRLERQRQMFQRFSGGQESFTLDQLNARSAQRFDGRGGAPGPGQDARPAR